MHVHVAYMRILCPSPVLQYVHNDWKEALKIPSIGKQLAHCIALLYKNNTVALTHLSRQLQHIIKVITVC